MNTTGEIMRKILILIAILNFYFTAYGQVATHSLDPTSIAEAPATAANRTYNTMGSRFYYGTGDREVSGETINELQTMGFDFMIGYQDQTWAGEVKYLPGYKTTVKSEGLEYDVNEQNILINLAFPLNDSTILGGKYQQYERHHNVDGIELYEAKETTMGVGLTWGMGERFFLGFGLETVEDEENENFRVGNKWMNMQLGIGFLMGDKNNPIRFEYSRISSAETVEESKDGKDGNVHPETLDSRIAIEYKSNESIYLFENQTITEKWNTDKSGTKFRKIGKFYNNAPFGKESKYVRYTIGFITAPNQGMTLGLKYHDQKEEYDTKNDGKTAALRELEFLLGYNY
jgi:hypothetical protein